MTHAQPQLAEVGVIVAASLIDAHLLLWLLSLAGRTPSASSVRSQLQPSMHHSSGLEREAQQLQGRSNLQAEAEPLLPWCPSTLSSKLCFFFFRFAQITRCNTLLIT